MSGRSTTLISYEPEIVADNTDGDDGQLAKLQEKVKTIREAVLKLQEHQCYITLELVPKKATVKVI